MKLRAVLVFLLIFSFCHEIISFPISRVVTIPSLIQLKEEALGQSNKWTNELDMSPEYLVHTASSVFGQPGQAGKPPVQDAERMKKIELFYFNESSVTDDPMLDLEDKEERESQIEYNLVTT